MSEYLDLDAALDEDEAAAKPLRVKLFGSLWELPGTVPAAVTVRIARWYSEGLIDEQGQRISDGKLTDAHYAVLLADMVPDDILRQWYARGLGTDTFARSVELLMQAYQGRMMQSGRAEGEAQAPAAGAAPEWRPFSSDGRPSRPTSPVSTGSSYPAHYGR